MKYSYVKINWIKLKKIACIWSRVYRVPEGLKSSNTQLTTQ